MNRADRRRLAVAKGVPPAVVDDDMAAVYRRGFADGERTCLERSYEELRHLRVRMVEQRIAACEAQWQPLDVTADMLTRMLNQINKRLGRDDVPGRSSQHAPHLRDPESQPEGPRPVQEGLAA